MDYLIYVFLVPLVVLIIIITGIVALFTNHNANSMDPNQISRRTSAKDFCLNLGAFIALYTLVASLLDLLFTIIDKAYPKITTYNDYYLGSSSPISWPVSILVVFFPVFILLMYFLEREYRSEPEKQNNTVHRGLTYITLFVSALVIVGDLVTVVYYFVDGQELTTGFLLKVVALLVIASSMFLYYITDLRGKLTARSRIIWRFVAGFIILGSIVWAFSVLGSPRTQQLLKYDEQKVTDLQSLKYLVEDYYRIKGSMPSTISDLNTSGYSVIPTDKQTGKSYEYILIGESAKAYQLCATFNKDSKEQMNGYATVQGFPSGTSFGTHPAGRYCFSESIPVDQYKPVPVYPLTPSTK